MFALLLNIDGAIGPAIQSFIEDGLQEAAAKQAHLVILQLDTPGGLDKSTRGIVKAIIASKVPVVTYVAPSGARAASAGVYIMYASHIAAMAPGTNLGAATPVAMGGSPSPLPKPGTTKDKQQGQSAPKQDSMQNKIINDATAYLASLAQMRGRNIEWAKKAVRKASSLTAKDALDQGVIDIVADTYNNLLKQINNRIVTVNNQDYQLQTDQNLLITHYKPNLKSQFLAVITDPNVAYILLLIGIYGIFLEFAHPGAVVPGVIGGISLLIALYALQLLPINYAGLALMLLGIAFIVAEAFVPSFGILGIGGILAFAIGSVLLIETNVPGYAIHWPVILTFSIINTAFFFMIITLALRSQRKKVVVGTESILGSPCQVIEDFTDRGKVIINGEIWQATTKKPLTKNQEVRVVKINGLILEVESINEDKN